ncbi:MAG: biotin--[acetyl-CoA-carboxylase] ligase [Aureliella sp.]
MQLFEQSVNDEILSRGWVRHIEWFNEIDSTHSAARRSMQKFPTGERPSLFLAQKQTAGRGRGGHQWWSPDGCLMLTLVLPGQLLPTDSNLWSQLALVTGHAVARTVAESLPNETVQLKWPNDVYARGKKLAGILIESASVRRSEGDVPAGACWLVGIGLNVNVDWNAAPQEVASRATCLSSLVSRPIDLYVVLVELLDELERELLSWRSGDMTWLSQWRERCLLTGRVIQVRQTPEHELIGVCEGLDAKGRLIVRDEQSVQFLSAGEVLAWQ